MREIPLTSGRGGVVLVDDADYDWLVAAGPWHAVKRNTCWYAVNGPRQGWQYMHRLIMGLTKGDGKMVDHCDLDGLNNQRANLRQATKGQQSANTRKRAAISGRPTSSSYRGIYRCRARGLWVTQVVGKDGKRRTRYSKDERKVAQIDNEMALDAWGPFARLNVIEDQP